MLSLCHNNDQQPPTALTGILTCYFIKSLDCICVLCMMKLVASMKVIATFLEHRQDFCVFQVKLNFEVDYQNITFSGDGRSQLKRFGYIQ